jgi:hypothetical protein
VQLKSGTITPAAGRFDIPALPAVSLDESVVHAGVQLYEPLGRGDRARYAAAGVTLLDYMPDRAYTAAIRIGTTQETLSNLGIRSVFALKAEDKLHPRILNGNLGEWSKYGVNERIFTVYLMKDTDIDAASARLETEQFKTGTRFEQANAVLVACQPQSIFELAAMDFVLFIEEASPPLSAVNNIVRQRLNVDSLHNAPYNLSGEGVTILIYDGGIADSSHPDFGNRMVMAETNAVAAHATHVAGTVGGDGTESAGLRRGMAPGVSLVTGLYDLCSPYCFYDSPNDVSDDFIHARTVFNVELTTASLGANIDPNNYDCDWFGDYEITSHLLDSLVRNTAGMPLTQFWAAGMNATERVADLAHTVAFPFRQDRKIS